MAHYSLNFFVNEAIFDEMITSMKQLSQKLKHKHLDFGIQTSKDTALLSRAVHAI